MGYLWKRKSSRYPKNHACVYFVIKTLKVAFGVWGEGGLESNFACFLLRHNRENKVNIAGKNPSEGKGVKAVLVQLHRASTLSQC